MKLQHPIHARAYFACSHAVLVYLGTAQHTAVMR